MKNSFVNSKITAFAAAVLMCCSVLLINTNVRAQGSCPDMTWTGSNSYTATIPGTTCSIKIWYCYTWVAGVFEIHITEVDPLSTACNSIGMPEIVKDAGTLVIFDPALSSNFIPCPTGTTVTTYLKMCWNYNSGLSGQQFTECAASTANCIETCTVCTDPNTGAVTESNCSWQESGMPDCEPWVPINPVNNTCYSIGCGIE